MSVSTPVAAVTPVPTHLVQRKPSIQLSRFLPQLPCLPFLAYCHGTDPLLTDTPVLDWPLLTGGDCVLELAEQLCQILESEYSLGLLQRGLLTLLPLVWLTVRPGHEAAVVDYPYLREPELDALHAWCTQQQYPGRVCELNALLDQLHI